VRILGLAPFAVVAAVLVGESPSSAAPINGDRVDQTVEQSLDEVYQRDLPGWDRGPDGGSGFGGGLGRGPRGNAGGGDGGGGDSGRGSGGALGSGGGGNPVGDGSGANPLGSGGSGDPGYNDDGTPRSRNGTPGDPRRRRRGHDASSGSSGEGDGGAFGGIAQVLLWGLLAVVVILFVVFIIRQTSGMTGAEEPVKTADDAGEDPNRLAAVIERPRDDADQLAHEGRFADAIHILLLRTVHELASQNLVRITPAMTSREVLARVPLLGDSRTALAGLVTAVEVTWFGDDVPGAEDYARCRVQFELFATAYRRGVAQQGARA